MFKRNRVHVVVALVWAFAEVNPAAAATDLLTTAQRTLGRDADLAQASAGYAAAQQAIPQARAGLLPQISGGWGRTYNRLSTDDVPSMRYWQSGWSVNIAQPLFDWTKWTSYKQASLIEARGAVELGAAQQAAILRAVRVYFELLAAEDEMQRVKDYANAVDQQVQLINRGRAGGEATLIDLSDAQNARQQVALQQMNAENILFMRRRAFEEATGAPIDKLTRLGSALPMPSLQPNDIEVWAAQARDHAFDVQLKQIDWKIAGMDVSKAKSAHLPSVYLTGSYTPAGAATGYGRPTTTTTGMVSVSIPLFTGGETQAKVKASSALEEKAQGGVAGASRIAEAAARDNFVRYEYVRTRIDVLTRLVASLRAGVTANQVGFRVGSRTTSDVLRTIDSLFSAQRDLLTARYDAIVSFLQLRGDVAALSLDDVARINEVLLDRGK